MPSLDIKDHTYHSHVRKPHKKKVRTARAVSCPSQIDLKKVLINRGPAVPTTRVTNLHLRNPRADESQHTGGNSATLTGNVTTTTRLARTRSMVASPTG